MNDTRLSFEEFINTYGTLVYTNVGTSMLPLIRQNRDLVVIGTKPERRLKRFDVPFYKRDNGQYVLHRIIRVRKKDYVLCGDNRRQKEYGITDDHVIGVMKAVIRNDRTVYTTDHGYRLYVAVWCGLFHIRAFILIVRDFVQRLLHGFYRLQKKRKVQGT